MWSCITTCCVPGCARVHMCKDKPVQSYAWDLASVCVHWYVSACLSMCDFDIMHVFLDKWVCSDLWLRDNCLLTHSSHPLKPHPVKRKCVNVFVKHQTEQQQNARSCSGESKSRQPPPLPVLLSLSPSPPSTPAPLWRRSLTPKPNGVLQSLSCYLSPSASFPIHSVAIGMFETPAW